MLQMIKITSLKSPFTTSCAHTAPYLESTLPSHTDMEKSKSSVSDSSWEDTALGQRSTDCLKAHFNFIGSKKTKLNPVP